MTSSNSTFIICINIERWDPKKYTILQMLRMVIILVELGLYESAVQLSGFQVILDLKHMTWTQVWHIELGLARKMVHWIMVWNIVNTYSTTCIEYVSAIKSFYNLLLQDCLPAKFQAVHIVNQPKWFYMAYRIFKPLLPKEFIKRVLSLIVTYWVSFKCFDAICPFFSCFLAFLSVCCSHFNFRYTFMELIGNHFIDFCLPQFYRKRMAELIQWLIFLVMNGMYF